MQACENGSRVVRMRITEEGEVVEEEHTPGGADEHHQDPPEMDMEMDEFDPQGFASS